MRDSRPPPWGDTRFSLVKTERIPTPTGPPSASRGGEGRALSRSPPATESQLRGDPDLPVLPAQKSTRFVINGLICDSALKGLSGDDSSITGNYQLLVILPGQLPT